MKTTLYFPTFKQIDQNLFGFMNMVSWRLLFVLLTGMAAVCLVCQILSITHRYPLDYGEAPLVDQVVRLIAGENIYRPDLSQAPFTISNYPPVFLLLQAPWVAIFGPNFWTGRILSGLGAWLSALFCGLIVFRLSADRLAAWLSSAVFIAIPYVIQWSSYARVDMPALALSLAGMYVLIQKPLLRRQLVMGGFLLTAAVYTRQTYLLAAPLAVFIWLLFEDWRRAIRLALWVGGAILGVGVLLQLLTASGFWGNIVTANVNDFGMARLQNEIRRIWADLPVLIVFGGLSFLAGTWKMRAWRLVTPYLFGGILSAVTIGKIGSNVNYLLELCAGLSMASGVVVWWVRSRQPSAILRVVIAAALVYQAVLLLQATLNGYAEEIAFRRSQAVELRQLEKIVASSVGDVPADEYMGMLVLQNRPIYIQPFELTQLAKAGRWDEENFNHRVRAQEFPLIMIHYFPGAPVYKERWTPTMLAAIESAYDARESFADTRIYRPKSR